MSFIDSLINQAQGNEDLILWPDGTNCTREELPEFGHMSDDYEVIPYYSNRWHKVMKELEA